MLKSPQVSEYAHRYHDLSATGRFDDLTHSKALGNPLEEAHDASPIEPTNKPTEVD